MPPPARSAGSWVRCAWTRRRGGPRAGRTRRSWWWHRCRSPRRRRGGRGRSAARRGQWHGAAHRGRQCRLTGNHRGTTGSAEGEMVLWVICPVGGLLSRHLQLGGRASRRDLEHLAARGRLSRAAMRRPDRRRSRLSGTGRWPWPAGLPGRVDQPGLAYIRSKGADDAVGLCTVRTTATSTWPGPAPKGHP